MQNSKIPSSLFPGICLLFLLMFTGSAVAAGDIRVGERIYNQGVLPSGEFIPATIHGDIQVTGEQVICASCHRKSGMGTSEGQQVVPAVSGNILFNPLRLPTSKPPLPPELRPAYDRESLKRALISGVGVKGDLLDPFMPRYKLSDEDLDGLIAYLNSLSSTVDPGVDEVDIHFATIVVGDKSSNRNKAMLDVFDAFITQKNTETRNESFRAANSPWHKEWMMKTYRKWRLHVWELSEDSDQWNNQLEGYYEQQPVFAVINGVVDGSFGPIHQFCEQNSVPCLFPTTMLPTLDESDFYTIYFNRGYIYEGETLAAYLNQQPAGKTIIHLTDAANAPAYHAAYGFRANLKNKNYKRMDMDCGVSDLPESTLSEIGRYQSIVLHMDRPCSDHLLKAIEKSSSKSDIYLSTRLYGVDFADIPDALKERTRFVHTHELPGRLNRLLARSTGWFKHKRILDPDQMEIQANAPGP